MINARLSIEHFIGMIIKRYILIFALFSLMCLNLFTNETYFLCMHVCIFRPYKRKLKNETILYLDLHVNNPNVSSHTVTQTLVQIYTNLHFSKLLLNMAYTHSQVNLHYVLSKCNLKSTQQLTFC